MRNRLAVAGALMIGLFALAAILAQSVAPHDPYALNLARPFEPPGAPGHLLGTDNFGRDILSRLIHGSRISLLIGIVVVALAGSVGTLLGLVSGYFGGWVDLLLMRLVELFHAFPFLILVIAVVGVLGPSTINVVWVLALVSWPLYARLVRAEVLRLREEQFAEAARAAGAGDLRIMAKHILPNSLTPVVVTATFGIPQAILASAALGFLGLGVQPPAPEWGAMISAGKDFILNAPWLVTSAGIFIMAAVMSFNFVGDGLRDALDPRRRDRSR
jgi:ABC-type dipeptide/oligopeptide/nickel transport system permease subunit